MSRRWKIAIALGATIVAFNLLLAAVHSLTGGNPGGPRSSSYATGGDGLAAYAELVADAGHAVERDRRKPHEREPDPADTVVLLDAGFVRGNDAAALRRFVEAGGRLVAGGGDPDWIRRIVGRGVEWSPDPVREGVVVAPVPEVKGVEALAGFQDGSWREVGGALPAYAGRNGALLAVAGVGAGRVLLLADAAPIQNAALDDADNAALGLGLAGPVSRQVVFLESFHGYGQATGIAAIPTDWWVLFGVGAAAVAAFILARGRRLGPPERAARELQPPRREYVESLGGVLARTRGRRETAQLLQVEAARLVAGRLGPAAGEDDVVAAATRLGLTPEDASALVRPATTDADLLAAGRAFASLARPQRRHIWKS
jgi:hypothetical protein